MFTYVDVKKMGELLKKYLKYIMGTFDKIWNESIKYEMPKDTLKMMQPNIFHCLINF